MTIAYDASRSLPRTKPLHLPRIKPHHVLFPLAVLLILYGAMVTGNSIIRQFQIWHEDSIATDIRRNHSHSLKFEVAGHKYEVVTPAIQLTDEMRTAWFNHAARREFPLYAADGPLAIDP